MSNVGSVGGAGAAHEGVSPEPASGAAENVGAQTEAVSLSSPQLHDKQSIADVARGTATIEIGARGEGTTTIQSALKELGHLQGRADGIFGRMTQRAVATFQRSVGLTPNGIVDAQTLGALDRELQIGTRRSSGEKPNDLVFLGMGDGGRFEIRDLRRQGVDVLGITDAPEDDKVTVRIDGADQTFDLTGDEGIGAFVAGLGVTGDRAKELGDIIRGAESDARDETALMVKTFLEAERGDRTLERLILSGHSVGSGVWGDSNGMFDLDILGKIAKAFPRAAGQLEDFMIAGCYSSSERHVAKFRSMFPNAKSIWAYGSSAPGTWSGAMVHNRLWEEASRGQDPGSVTRSIADGTRKGENVATWNIDAGYLQAGHKRPLDTVRGELDGMASQFAGYFSGASAVQDTQYGPLRDYYRLVQELLGSTELPEQQRPGLEGQRDQTIRLIFYDARIKGLFQDNYGERTKAGFEALGLEVPDFGALSRQDALAKVSEFEAALQCASEPKPQAATELLPLLTRGLRDLERSFIPNTWV
ncbi:peptidoglycan-binding protein [Planctomycetota bacterium]